MTNIQERKLPYTITVKQLPFFVHMQADHISHSVFMGPAQCSGVIPGIETVEGHLQSGGKGGDITGHSVVKKVLFGKLLIGDYRLDGHSSLLTGQVQLDLVIVIEIVEPDAVEGYPDLIESDLPDQTAVLAE